MDKTRQFLHDLLNNFRTHAQKIREHKGSNFEFNGIIFKQVQDEDAVIYENNDCIISYNDKMVSCKLTIKDKNTLDSLHKVAIDRYSLQQLIPFFKIIQFPEGCKQEMVIEWLKDFCEKLSHLNFDDLSISDVPLYHSFDSFIYDNNANDKAIYLHDYIDHLFTFRLNNGKVSEVIYQNEDSEHQAVVIFYQYITR